MFKIETHLHTKIISECGWLYPKELVKMYTDGGYSAICVTDHYNRDCFTYAGIDIKSSGDRIGAFLEGYAKMKEEGEKRGLRIYKGAELRFDQCNNDYLLFGFHDELLNDPDSVMKMGIQNFITLARKDGAVLLQAHPFRDGGIPAPAEYLDGIEVYNPNRRHDGHNDMSREYARRHGLLIIGGSDCHRPGDECKAGILSNYLPRDSFEFASMLKSGNYTLIAP